MSTIAWIAKPVDDLTDEKLRDLIQDQFSRGLQLSLFAACASIVVASIYDWQVAAIWLGAHVFVDGLSHMWDRWRIGAVRAGEKLTHADLVMTGISFFLLPSIWCVIALLAWYSGHPYGQLIGLATVICGAVFMAIDKPGLNVFLFVSLTPFAVTLGTFVIEATVLSGDATVLIVAITTILAVCSAAYRTEANAAQLRIAKIAAENANRSKSEFLAAMGHEIRTPMNAVLGMAELLAREELTPTARENVRTIRHSGQLLMAILNDVLDMSKIEAGKMSIEKIAFSTGSVMDQVQRLWAPRAEDKGLALAVVSDPSLPKGALGDPSRLQQILFNLVSNALKFTKQGTVTVHARAERRGGGIGLVFTVSDTGIGMDAETQGRLFSAFAQANNSTAREYGGTGLGLAISRKLAEAMGGTLTVASEPGKGSVFTLDIPSREAVPISRTDEAAEGGAVRGLKILLAEDHKVNQRLILAFLAPHGHVVRLVENGEAAVAEAAREAFDVILMDVQMPKMNGLEATRAIRSGGANALTPIIGLSADAFEDQRRAGLAAGMNDYVTKPIDPRALAAAIAKAAGGNAGRLAA
jgi:signal transduction histidine kinase/ActR/RegA family two-component response regulator